MRQTWYTLQFDGSGRTPRAGHTIETAVSLAAAQPGEGADEQLASTLPGLQNGFVPVQANSTMAFPPKQTDSDEQLLQMDVFPVPSEQLPGANDRNSELRPNFTPGTSAWAVANKMR